MRSRGIDFAHMFECSNFQANSFRGNDHRPGEVWNEQSPQDCAPKGWKITLPWLKVLMRSRHKSKLISKILKGCSKGVSHKKRQGMHMSGSLFVETPSPIIASPGIALLWHPLIYIQYIDLNTLHLWIK